MHAAPLLFLATVSFQEKDMCIYEATLFLIAQKSISYDVEAPPYLDFFAVGPS
jgi:hypothetical protein